MLKSIDLLLHKEIYTIKDLSYLLGKQSQTIRKWEQKGIIPSCTNYGKNGWRQYSPLEFANILEKILDYPWERNCISNAGQVQYVINYIRKVH